MKSSPVILIVICCSALVSYSHERTGISLEGRGDIDPVVALQDPSVGRPDFPETPPPTGVVRGIAEFEPCQGVLVKFVGTEPGLEFAVPVELIAAMSEVVVVTTIVRDQIEEDYALELLRDNDVNVANCSFIHSPIGPDGLWVRDYVPWTTGLPWSMRPSSQRRVSPAAMIFPSSSPSGWGSIVMG